MGLAGCRGDEWIYRLAPVSHVGDRAGPLPHPLMVPAPVIPEAPDPQTPAHSLLAAQMWIPYTAEHAHLCG